MLQHTHTKPLAQKLDERVFEKLLKYNPQTQNLWDIVGIFEFEREKLRLEVAQYLEDIKSSQATLKELREQIKEEQKNLKTIQETLSSLPKQKELATQSAMHQQILCLQTKITELELENSKLFVEMRDLRSENQLQENLAHLSSQGHPHSRKNVEKNERK